ncbi:MAG: ATP-binding cassette domain-containing protein [Candidatus Latescibacteria bacterium]|nr:ATP-binding cassette domain-containing protein [Candidatus Latescibacterota bacterium]NIM20921.1 ATP-binding cassette domain-containing protein [Candidatus Latescibacterota bacterium]NIM65056.1 ATP-binding cassette domain-containing protein [Candidatus Latescibacterota bacterium]NIO01571.1 ATP-binding cassette domain-containing protein [Candidatus Latescibacterota bacterium]NIO28088.1 ATP-binding cassette domain-containing protein [Candidatus Latescibacterota bacterium]
MIEVQNLTKQYGETTAISDVTFQAEQGEILGFLGPNGAGKTTTMRILTCFLPPTSGRARIAGFDVLEDSLEVRKRVGYLPENVPLYHDLSVVGYLDFVGKLKGMSKQTRMRRIGEVSEECGTDDVAERTIGKLSKGYRQRVGLAQALLNDPEVLILDEPTIGLDPKQILEIRQLIRSLAGRRTIILSTHILPEVSLLCQRVIIINKGKLIIDDTPENLKYRLRSTMSLDILIRGPKEAIISHLQSLPEVESVAHKDTAAEDTHNLRIDSAENRDIRELISRSVVEKGFGLMGMTAIEMSLEDVFVQLVTEEDTIRNG